MLNTDLHNQQIKNEQIERELQLNGPESPSKQALRMLGADVLSDARKWAKKRAKGKKKKGLSSDIREALRNRNTSQSQNVIEGITMMTESANDDDEKRASTEVGTKEESLDDDLKKVCFPQQNLNKKDN